MKGRKTLSILLSVALVLSTSNLTAYATEVVDDTPALVAEETLDALEAPEEADEAADPDIAPSSANDGTRAKRTIMLYDCGADLETDGAMATYNLHQILQSHFSSDDDVRFIVMTGGSARWQLESEYLSFTEGVRVPDDAVTVEHSEYYTDPTDPFGGYEEVVVERLEPTSEISGVYNQLWEAKGADAPENAGKLVLLDGNGITGVGDEDVKSENELMSDPETLKAFINYCADHFPAEKYDLVLWDHGGGPQSGFGVDEHNEDEIMSFAGIVDALAHNAVTDTDGDGTPDSTFDLVDFDACLMNSVELALVMADYTDYYVASAEVEPGYGQYYGPHDDRYTGWLDELGNAAKDAVYDAPDGSFALGKVIVDDFYRFYEKDSGDGASQDGTLAVIDTQKMVANRELSASLAELNRVLLAEACYPDQELGGIAFYDEMLSFANTIEYGESQLLDLGDLAALLAVRNAEIREGDLDGEGNVINENNYHDVARMLNSALKLQDSDPDNAFMYARGTSGIKVADKFYKNANDEIVRGDLGSTGLSIFFSGTSWAGAAPDYYAALDPVLDAMPSNDWRKAFLQGYEEVVASYALIVNTGRTVSNTIEALEDETGLVDKNAIDYEMIADQWDSPWGIRDVVEASRSKVRSLDPDSPVGTDEWFRTLVDQQVADAILPENVSAAKISDGLDDGYRVTIKDARKCVVADIVRNVFLELPVMERYLDIVENNPDLGWEGRMIRSSVNTSIGAVEGKLADLPEDDSYKSLIKWYRESGGVWDMDALEPKWYALNDANGALHVASIDHIDDDGIYVPAIVGATPKGEADEQDRLILMEFSNDADANGQHALLSFYHLYTSAGPIQVDPKTLVDELTIVPVLRIKPMFGRNFHAPISKSTFTLSAANADSVTLEFTDIANIEDIEDTDGDGKVMHSTVSLKDLYGYPIDINDRVMAFADGEYTGIGLATVKPAVLGGGTEELAPTVVYNGETLQEGVDYTWKKKSASDVFNAPGSYSIVLTGMGRFAGKTDATFVIAVSEEEATAAVEIAQTAVNEAQQAVDDLPSNASAEEVRSAYDRLVKAQQALVDAQEALARTEQILSDQRQEQLQQQIDNLEQQVNDLTAQLAEASVIDISNFGVSMKTSLTYTGKALKPAVKVTGLTAADYTVSYADNVNVGTAKVTIKAKGSGYKGTISKTFKITKAKNPLSVSGKTVKVAHKKLRKKAQTLKASAIVKVAKKGQGTTTYTLSSAKKGSKSFKKYFALNKKNGSLTVKKGLAKGTYTLKVQVKAAGNKNYKAATKTVTVKVKVS